jgi:two-component system, sensor histidine kinase and response regulator
LSLLIVDDEPASMRALCDTLEFEGYRTYGFTSPGEALAAMRERQFDLLLADLQMPGTNGIDLMKSAQLIDPTLVAVIMTGHGALETAIAAMKAGALDYIQKPIKLVTTLPVLERALAVRQLRIEKKRLEENVRERTEELKIANRELEAFSYSVSHDLRAPLRAVSVFTQALLSDHVTALTDEGKRLLQNVNAGAAHMDRLITDLLRLSQLNRQPLHKAPARFSELAQKVIDGMTHERAGRDIEFVIADFPTWQVDVGLIQQVFVNLISNAIKFTRERDKARIEIGYRMDGTSLVVFVKDNGVGFNMKYMNKLFGVFQRLHSADQFEGTGVGLSIVRRIVERHGGKVWVDGGQDQGATFYFSLPDGG